MSVSMRDGAQGGAWYGIALGFGVSLALAFSCPAMLRTSMRCWFKVLYTAVGIRTVRAPARVDDRSCMKPMAKKYRPSKFEIVSVSN
jgi:hypothetical protein